MLPTIECTNAADTFYGRHIEIGPVSVGINRPLGVSWLLANKDRLRGQLTRCSRAKS